MKPLFGLGLRGRLIVLLLVVFSILIGLVVWQFISDREERVNAAAEELLGHTRLIAARQQSIAGQANTILNGLLLSPELRPGASVMTCAQFLSERLKPEPELLQIGKALPDGGVVCAAIPPQGRVNVADQPWFQQALQTHEMVVSDLQKDRIQGKTVVTMSKGVWDEAGRISAVVYVDLSLDLTWLRRQLAAAHLSEGARLVLVDARGMVALRAPDPEGWIGKSATQLPLFRRIQTAGGEGTAEDIGLDGERRIFAYSKLQDTVSGPVYVWLALPKAEIVALAQRQAILHAGMILAMLMGVMGVLVLGGNRLLLRPLQTLSRAAARFGTGDFSVRSGLPHGDGELGQLAKTMDDAAGAIEDRERKLARTNRALRIISAGNQAMLRATSEQQLIENLCREIVEAGGYRIAWIGYAENDTERTIRPVAQWGTVAKGFFENARLTWSDAEGGRTPAGSAIRNGTPAAVRDISKEAGPEPWRQNALRCGCGSCVALPLHIGDSVIGVLDVCAEETGAFDDEEVRLLAEAAADLSYGIAALRGMAEMAPLRTALRIAEEHFCAAANASLDALFILKSVRGDRGEILDFEFTDLNTSSERLLGMAREQVIGQKLCELIPINRTGGFFDKYVAVVATGTPLEEEFSIDTPAIKAKWLRQQIVRVDDGVAISSRDITEWKTAGAHLRESEETLRAIASSAQDAILMLDNEGKIVLWNEAAQKMFGHSSGEAVGKNLHLLLAPARFHEAHRNAFSHFSSTGEGAVIGKTLELAALRKDGAEFPIELSLSAVKLKDKWHAVGIVRDVTKRKQGEEVLHENQAQLDLALRSASMGVWHWDVIENKRHFDAQACRLVGIDPAMFTGAAEEFFSVVHPDDWETLKAAMARTVDQGVLYEPEYRVIWPDGGIHYITARGRLVRDSDGQPIRVNGIIWDTSARKQGELALKKSNRALLTLGACNEALVHATNEPELLASICRIIVETGGYHMTWIGFPENDPEKTVRPVAVSGKEDNYLATVRISWGDNEFGHGPTGMAIRSGTIQIYRSTSTDPALAPWREEQLKRGYQSGISLPLTSPTGTLGVLGIYAHEPDAFNESEVKLLQELADDLAFGIVTLRTRTERDRIAHEQLHHVEILRQSLEDSLKAIADTVLARDPYTAGHQTRVGQLAVAIAREMGLPEETIHGIGLAASVHDLGKISVPAEILSKPGRLTDIEYMLVKTHVQSGYDILKDIRFPWPIAIMVWQHHERMDGSGYPQGLKGDEIMLESRILAVADVVEAMASHRPYRPALGIEAALGEIERGRGSVYDATVVDACLKVFREKEFAFQG